MPNLFPIHAPYIATSLSYGGITRRIAVAQLRLRFYKSINQCKTVGLVLPAAGKIHFNKGTSQEITSSVAGATFGEGPG